MQAFQGQYNIDYGGLAAYSVMVLLPELVFYGIFQRHVVDGMTVGAVKGKPQHIRKGMLPWQHPLFVQGVSETCLCILQPQRVLSRSMSLTPSVRWYEEKLGSSIILTMISAAELAIFSVFCQTVVMDGVTISERNVPS